MMKKKEDGEAPKEKEKPRLALTSGDPCGVGPEIVLRAMADPRSSSAARLLVLGSEALLRSTAKRLKLRWPFGAVVDQLKADKRWEKPLLLDCGDVSEELVAGQISAEAGKASAQLIERAVELCLEGRLAGVVTAPVHKESLSLAGYADPGHTEMLQRLSGARRVGMMFWTPEFSTGLLTTHMSTREALRKIRRGRIFDMLKLFDQHWERLFGERPTMVVAGLNPHAGEGGRFGVEEIQQIQPAIERAREKGLRVDGPVPADSVFALAREGRYQFVLSLYHDQATIPVKLVARQQSVNVTVGLPFIRTSVDHGTAMDIAGKGIASCESLVQAVLLAARLATGNS